MAPISEPRANKTEVRGAVAIMQAPVVSAPRWISLAWWPNAYTHLLVFLLIKHIGEISHGERETVGWD